MNETDPAHRYFVDDRHDSSVPATRLRNILDRLQEGRPLSAVALTFLQREGLDALRRLALGELGYDTFTHLASAERIARRHSAEASRLAEEAARRVEQAQHEAREAAWAERHERERQRAESDRRARESDPRVIAKVQTQQLRARYGLEGFIDERLFSQVMRILRNVDDGNRLTDDDVLWLETEGSGCYSDALRAAHHEREADFLAAEYFRTNDPWHAVNASGHYRKCDQATKAHELLILILPDQRMATKLQSALRTTHGGVMRDLGRLSDAFDLGNAAHALTPKDFRPCTLLGAVCIELGRLSAGWDWYRKAEERGASERSIDHDLRAIFQRAIGAKREEMRSFLVRQDPERYKWVNGATPTRSARRSGEATGP